MSKQNYNWNRFWYSRESKPKLTDDGFLYNPDYTWGSIFNPEAKSFASISAIPCLILLGEPGSGKTYEIKLQQKEFIQNRPDAIVILEDLGSYQSEDRFCRTIFENSIFQAWLTGKHKLYLFLDSLDEGLLNIRVLARLLENELEKHSSKVRDRLYLRITCRSADWPIFLEEKFRHIWGNDNVGVYQLAPLRDIDVAEAAQANGLEPNKFIEEISQKQITPLAVKPVTLKFLLSAYKNGKSPDSQTNLYREGCRLLCEEDEKRTNTAFKETADALQRVAIAAQIAFITVFANQNTISTDIYQTSENGSINVRDLVRAGDNIKFNNFPWSEAAIKEVLGTGLFITRGSKTYGWAHQSYAEFLAAEYIIKSNMALTQILSLIIHPLDGNLIPQLQQTVAWIASMSKEVFKRVLELEPQILLNSDISTSRNDDRAILAKALLELYDKEKLPTPRWNGQIVYAKLNYPGITELIHPYLTDSCKNEIVRREAIDFITACQLHSFQNDLANIVLDEAESEMLRVCAAYALEDIADENIKLRLKPCLSYNKVEDPKDNLKGSALRLLWPKHLSAKELFEVLTPPQREGYSGAYQLFLSSVLPHLQPADLPIALQWVEKLPDQHQIPFRFFEIADGIMLMAWEHLMEPNILAAFSKAVLSRFWYYDQPLSQHIKSDVRVFLGDDEQKRHAVLLSIIPALSRPEFNSMLPLYTHSLLIRAEDVPWLLQLCETETDQTILLTLARIINLIRSQDQFDLLFYAAEKVPFLMEFFGKEFKAIDLGSTEAIQHKEDYEKNKKWLDGSNQKQLLDPSPSERINYWLEEAAAGNDKAWFQLCMALTLKPDSIYWEKEYLADLTSLPGWQAADSQTKARILEAAKNHITTQTDHSEEWLGRNAYSETVMAGYKALRLLIQEDNLFIENLPKNIWENWTAIIVTYPQPDKTEYEKVLVAKAYFHAPDRFTEALIKQLQLENRIGYITLLPKLQHCWDNHLCSVVLEQVKKDIFSVQSIGAILEQLIAQDNEPAIEYAKNLVISREETDEAPKAVMAACALLGHAKDAGWSILWPAIEQDSEFGRSVLSRFVFTDAYDEPRLRMKLKESQLADFYIWISRQYPHKDDPQHDGVHSVGTREAITLFRNALLRYLRDLGSIEACEAIKKIIQKLPELDWLKWTLLAAQQATRRNTWFPPSPKQLLELSNNQQKRFVQSGEQLLDLVLKTLEKLQEELQGETPSAPLFWEKYDNDKYRPKDENSFSDHVKRHLVRELKQSGIIVNREVEIRPGRGGPGERTDIHVDAVVTNKDEPVKDVVTAIIEVKGCWHRDLENAMEDQLLNRYLKDNHCQYGLYLIGWFKCSAWSEDDYRKGNTPNYDLAEARSRFNGQAESLSKDGIVIKSIVLNAALHHNS